MRAILIILDSVGIGELPDAKEYKDEGSNTLVNIKKQVQSMNLKNLNKLGLSNIIGGSTLCEDKIKNPKGSFCRLIEQSKGKDTTVGHWEIAGIITKKPFPVYPEGFPKNLIDQFEKEIKRKIIGNCVASGTEIINKLGDEHVKTGKIILYTSADSVFQLAAHENIINIEELYKICEIARNLLKGEHNVSRVIARPFLGNSGNYIRTKNRKDFSIKPHSKTMLDFIKEEGLEVVAVGKIGDIFCNKGITKIITTKDNMDGVDKTLEAMKNTKKGLIFTNLVDFDMIYGHRNDVKGYAKALVDFDNRLPEILKSLKEEDILFITADHGCDPTTPSTDHSREYIPLIIYGNKVKEGINLGTRDTFADIGESILDYLNINKHTSGKSFIKDILK